MTTAFKTSAGLLVTAIATAIVGGCAKPSPSPAVRASAASNATSRAAQEATGVAPQQEQREEKRPRFGDAAVYVDGKSVGVLRILELPLALKPHATKLGSGDVVPRFWMDEYLASIGVDAKKVRALHLYGGTRVSALDGEELRRIQGRLTFSFTQGDRGKPRIHWPSEPINVSTTIDMISAMTIYVDKEPPVVSNRKLVFADGSPAEGVPYAASEQGNGTRVYVDGKLIATVKRKGLTSDLLVPGDESHASFSLPAYLASVGAGAAPRAIDFVRGDDLVERFDGKTMSEAKKVSFSVPSHSHGMVRVATPDRSAKVSAIELYVKTNPPARHASAATSDDEEDHTPGANRGGGDDATGE